MNHARRFQSTLAPVASHPRELTDADAVRAVDAGLGRLNELDFKGYVHWLLQWADAEAAAAIRVAYLTVHERSGV